jgi:hypothetical protein
LSAEQAFSRQCIFSRGSGRAPFNGVIRETQRLQIEITAVDAAAFCVSYAQSVFAVPAPSPINASKKTNCGGSARWRLHTTVRISSVAHIGAKMLKQCQIGTATLFLRSSQSRATNVNNPTEYTQEFCAYGAANED